MVRRQNSLNGWAALASARWRSWRRRRWKNGGEDFSAERLKTPNSLGSCGFVAGIPRWRSWRGSTPRQEQHFGEEIDGCGLEPAGSSRIRNKARRAERRASAQSNRARHQPSSATVKSMPVLMLAFRREVVAIRSCSQFLASARLP